MPDATGTTTSSSKTTPTTLIVAALVAALLGGGVGWVLGSRGEGDVAAPTTAPTPTGDPATSTNPPTLYVVSGPSGQVTSGPDGPMLTIDGAQAVWFTDRPVRDAGTVAAGQLVGSWGDSFSSSAPNAALAATAADGQVAVTTVVLGQPTIDETTGAVTVPLSPDGEDDAALDSLIDAPSFGVALFIDDANPPSGATTTPTTTVDIRAEAAAALAQGQEAIDTLIAIASSDVEYSGQAIADLNTLRDRLLRVVEADVQPADAQPDGTRPAG